MQAVSQAFSKAVSFPGIAIALLAASSIFLAGCDPDQGAGREENYVTVRLNDSLSRYDNVEILILADGDTGAVIGTVWEGRLAAPVKIPSYRLDDAETRTLSVRVKGYDSSGRLALDMRISKRNGAQVVANVEVPRDTVVVPPDTTQADPFSAWKHMALVRPDFAQAGMGGFTEVTDFPVLLRLTPSDFDLAEAGENGKDIRFATRDHRVLPHEIAFWDAQAGSARIWIKADTLRGDTSNGSIRMYWGNPSAASASDPAKVFTVDAGWSGVWHLDEEGKGASGEYKDATGRFHGTSSGKAVPSRTEGAVGHAQDFKTTGAQAAIAIPAAFDPGPDAWTMTFWVRHESQGKGVIFAKGDGTATDKERFQLIVQQDGRLGAQRHAGKAFTNVYFPANAWCLAGIVSEGTVAHFYIDGVKKETLAGGQGPDALAKVFLGALNADGADGYDGSLDEVWFSRTARTKDFIRLLFENQKPDSPFLTVSPRR